MAAIPYDRVRSIIFGDGSNPRTPTTLSGDSNNVYSYAKRIAWKQDGQWYVVTRDSSRTTNRHISAVYGVLSDQRPTLVGYHSGKPIEEASA